MAGVGCCSCLLGGEADAYDGDAGVVVDTVLPMGVQRLSRRLLMRRLAMLSMMLMLLLLMVMKMMWMSVMVMMMMMMMMMMCG